MPEETPETNEKDMGKHGALVWVGKAKIALFIHLDHVLNVSNEKFSREKSRNRDRQCWARIIVAAVEGYGRLLESVQFEALEARITLLEHPKTEEEKQ